MTVAIGLVCSDGVLVASDSMASSEFKTAQLATKVYASGTLPFVWTGAGSVYVIEEVSAFVKQVETDAQAQPLRDAILAGEQQGIRNALGQNVANTMKRCYANALPLGLNQQGNGVHAFNSSFLIAGWSPNGAWFLEVAHDGQMNWHHASLFAAVGSGGAFASVAHGLMAHYLDGTLLPVHLGTQLAYRTIETTCQVSTGGVGLPVQLAVADANGARVIDPDEVQQVKDSVAAWKQLERETLLNPGPAGQQPEPLPALGGDPPVAE